MSNRPLVCVHFFLGLTQLVRIISLHTHKVTRKNIFDKTKPCASWSP
jgi:hypothetical protein